MHRFSLLEPRLLLLIRMALFLVWALQWKQISRYCEIAAKVAREAVVERTETIKVAAPFVFGSIGPLLESYRPDKIVLHDEGVKVYSCMVQTLAASVDAFLGETLSSLEEAMQVIGAVGSLATSLRRPVMISYTDKENGNLCSGHNVCREIPRLIEYAEQHNV